MNLALRNLLKQLPNHTDLDITPVTTKTGVSHLDSRLTNKAVILPPLPQPLIEQLFLPIAALVKKADLILSPYNTFPLFSPCARLAIIHDVIYLHSPNEVYYSPAAKQNIGRIYRKLIVKNFLNKVDQIVTDSEFSKDEILTLTNTKEHKIAVIPLAAEKPKVCLEQTSEIADFNLTENPFFLHLSAIDPRKNTAWVVHQFQNLTAQHSGIHLVLVGKLPKSLIEVVDGNDRMHFLGYVNDQQLSQLYRQAIGILFPSSFEGFGLPVLEAFEHETAVITTALSSIPEIARNAAIYVEKSTPESLRQAMAQLLGKPQLRSQLAARGSRIAREYSWAKTAQKYYQLIRNLIG